MIKDFNLSLDNDEVALLDCFFRDGLKRLQSGTYKERIESIFERFTRLRIASSLSDNDTKVF